MVDTEVDKFMTWLRSRAAIPTVIALRERFDSIRKAELARLEPKLAKLTPDARARLEEVTRLLVEKLLLAPTEQLKAATDEESVTAYAETLNRLFKLHDQVSSPESEIRNPLNDSVLSSPRGRDH
jgi:glutamyl-tRNA reductase